MWEATFSRPSRSPAEVDTATYGRTAISLCRASGPEWIWVDPDSPRRTWGDREPFLLRSNITRAQVGMMDLALFEFRTQTINFL